MKTTQHRCLNEDVPSVVPNEAKISKRRGGRHLAFSLVICIHRLRSIEERGLDQSRVSLICQSQNWILFYSIKLIIKGIIKGIRIMIPPINIKEAWFITCTAASHQGAIEMIWVHLCKLSCFQGGFTFPPALRLNIYIHGLSLSLYLSLSPCPPLPFTGCGWFTTDAVSL